MTLSSEDLKAIKNMLIKRCKIWKSSPAQALMGKVMGSVLNFDPTRRRYRKLLKPLSPKVTNLKPGSKTFGNCPRTY